MKNSRIEWTDHTWNPWYGCHKVSQGCKNCYMFREQRLYGRDPNVVQRSKTTFNAPLVWAKKGEQAHVFACSWSDFFIEEADAWRDEAWDIIRQTPDLIYLILSKRLELVLPRLPSDWGKGWGNVMIGASVENQEMARLRIPQLLAIPGRHFLSCEPLLGVIDLVAATPDSDKVWDEINNDPEEFIEECEAELDWINTFKYGIDWVIAGGESGPGARWCHPDWVRAIRDLCVDADVPFFFKQWGEWLPVDQDPLRDVPFVGNKDPMTIAPFTWRRVGRKVAGHLLDGREWLQFPIHPA